MSVERPIVREAGRWYSRDGKPVNEVKSADGKRMVKPNVLHARKYGNKPSVTYVLQLLRDPGLEQWQKRQIVMAALSVPRPAGVSDADWNDIEKRTDMIIGDAEAQVESAANKGKDWHAIIENALLGRTLGQLNEIESGVVAKFKGWLTQELGEGFSVVVERSLISDRFGLTPDIVAQDRDLTKTLLCDIKTVADDSPMLLKAKPYRKWLYQIAPYWRCTDADITRCWEAIVGRESGAVRFHLWPQSDITEGWKAFSLLMQFWTIHNNYDPLTWTGKDATKEA